MSQQQHNLTQKQLQNKNKTKQERQKQKALTSAWLKKQQQKKKKKQQQKQQQKQPIQLDQKALQKAKRKEQKRLERQQMLKQQQQANGASIQIKTQIKQEIKPQLNKKNNQEVKVQKKQVKPQKQVKKQQKIAKDYPKQKKIAVQQQSQKLRTSGNNKKQQKQVKPSSATNKQAKNTTQNTATLQKPTYPELKTLESHALSSKRSSSILFNKQTQQKFIFKELQNYLSPNDTILILSKSDKWIPQATLYNRRVFLHPTHEQFYTDKNQDIVICTYEDIAFLMQGTLTKVFVQLELVFTNGYSLTHKGHQNIITLANQFKIPVVGFTGTWNFNGWNYLSRQMLLNKYGQKPLVQYDVLQNNSYEIIVMEIGSVVPKQLSGHWDNIQKIYRECDLNIIQW